jgi:DNA-directed RNA polymerase III subunit RPC4
LLNLSGKLQIRKSGRTQLLIGNMAMDVNFGTQVGFLQELVSINIPPNETEIQVGQQRPFGDIAVLGRVRHRLVITPNWSKLFSAESSPEPEESSSDEEGPS